MQSWVLTAIIVWPEALVLLVVLEGSPSDGEPNLSDEAVSPPQGPFYSFEGCFACAAVLRPTSARSIDRDFIDCNWLRVDDASARPVHGGRPWAGRQLRRS